MLAGSGSAPPTLLGSNFAACAGAGAPLRRDRSSAAAVLGAAGSGVVATGRSTVRRRGLGRPADRVHRLFDEPFRPARFHGVLLDLVVLQARLLGVPDILGQLFGWRLVLLLSK